MLLSHRIRGIRLINTEIKKIIKINLICRKSAGDKNTR
jgi:hypothetical protein